MLDPGDGRTASGRIHGSQGRLSHSGMLSRRDGLLTSCGAWNPSGDTELDEWPRTREIQRRTTRLARPCDLRHGGHETESLHDPREGRNERDRGDRMSVIRAIAIKAAGARLAVWV